MDKRFKETLLLVAFGVACFATLMNLTTIFAFAKKIFAIFLPIIIGFLIAFIMSVPMRGFERFFCRLFRKWKHKPGEKAIATTSFILTLISVALVIVLVSTIFIPELIESITSICILIEKSWPEWANTLTKYNINTEKLSELIGSIDFNRVIDTVSGRADMLLGSVVNISTSIVSGVVTFLFGLIIGLYALSSKNELARQSKRILYAFVKETLADKVCRVASLMRETYAKFFSGQCIEAVILGVLILITFSIFKLPYAALIAVLTSVCAFIPYVGAFASCFIGAFLILLSNPSKVLLCIVIYIVVQFIETQFIYPRVVGKSVGLPPLLTLLAAMMGGKIFGLVGILFFIPLVAVFYELMQESIEKRLTKKHIKKIS